MGYEPAAGWAAYYEELEPEEREAILRSNLETLPDDGENEFRRRLFTERYRDPKRPARQVDNYLWNYLYLPELYQRRRDIFSGFRRELRGILKFFHLDDPDALSDREKETLYLEFRNAAARFLEACRSDLYGSRLMGLIRAKKEEQHAKACADVWRMSRGIAAAAGLEREMELFRTALYDTLTETYPECREQYEALDRELSGRP